MNIRDNRDEAVKLFTNFAFASVYLAVTMLITRSSFTGIGMSGLLSSVYIGIFEMGLTFWLWLMAMRHATTNALIGNLVYLTPFISLIFVHFILGEPVYYTTPVGLILIVGGIIYQNHRKRGVTE